MLTKYALRATLLAAALAVVVPACITRAPVKGPPSSVRPMTTTGYCKCKKCCAWRRNWYGAPVYATGPNKGERKKVGVTASGTQGHVGTIAADTSRYPFGTVMYIPGYGYGKVEDVGGAIKGDHIDLFFKKHKQALEWGRQTKQVQVWLPKDIKR